MKRWQGFLFLLVGLLARPAQGEEIFKLPRASTRADVELRVERCARDAHSAETSCEGKMTVTLFKKSTKAKLQSFAVKEIHFSLIHDNAPSVNVTNLYDEQSVLVFDDFDFDGEEDLAIQRFRPSAYAPLTYTIYLYDPGRRALVRSRPISRLADEGLGLFEVDRKAMRLHVYSKDGCCFHQRKQYAIVAGEPTLTQTNTNDHDELSVNDVNPPPTGIARL